MEYELHGGLLLPPVQTLAATIIFLSNQERKMQIESLPVPQNGCLSQISKPPRHPGRLSGVLLCSVVKSIVL
jgi:hypothetical protein